MNKKILVSILAVVVLAFGQPAEAQQTIGPILEIACAAVNFVNDDATRFCLFKKLKHPVETGTTSLCCGLYFFKPVRNLQSISLSVARDSITLLLKRNPLLALFDRGYADVAIVV